MDESPFVFLRSEFIRQGKKLRFVIEHFDVGGKEFAFEKVEHPGAVVVLPLTAAGEILFVRQYRPAISRWTLELPAGTMDKPGEPPADCAARELAEEAGRGASRWVDLGTIHPAPGFCDEVQYCFFASELFPRLETPDEDEFIELRPMHTAAVYDAVRAGEITDGKSIACLLRAQLAGLLPEAGRTS